MSFKCEVLGEIVVWTGDPDCGAAVAALGAYLATTPVPRLPRNHQLTNTHIGNLGETLAFLVGRASSFPVPTHRVIADNCANPLAGGSKTGVDILWIAFHPSNPAADHAWIQEVKTTTDPNQATYIAKLKDDYRKLFARRPGLTLEDRLGDVSFRLEQMEMEPDLARRTRALGARSARQVTRVSLVPTGVFDLAADAMTVLEDVRITLVQELAWTESQVTPLLIGLSTLETRLRGVALK